LPRLRGASARDEYWYESGYDVAYDWTDDLGKWAWEQVFDERAEIAARLDRALAADPRPERVFRFLDNNDTGPRFVTRYGPLLTRAAAALVLTLPGIPCVYTGEEVGAEYEPYGEAGIVDWEADPHGLREWYRALCRLRASRPALRGAAWARVGIAPDRGDCYAYVRGEPGPEAALVLLNFGDDEARMQVTLPDGFEALARASALVDVLGDEEVSGPAAGISVPPGSARVLEERR
jgi:cyclomaltodextrinase / maltogenic alpha-amylase / neopullulanase